MDEQTNDQVQAVCQDIEGLKDQLAKILELLTTGRGKSVAGISSQVEVDLNQVLEDMPAYPPGFTLQRLSSPRMTYPTQNPNPITQQENHVSDPMSTPITEIGADMYGSINATQLCLISDVVIPPKFKTPNFENLVGPTSRWYMQLDGSQVHRWKDLADSFLKQYKYNIDMAPDRLDLQRMEKKNAETFKEYAQR
ncbi:Gag-pro-like protein [Cucumis melo var. makuwa]|uniref:Gag-pro-like protein n=1 Tax=Cucumis melo var. makuwa TaxID=1194695 RepID=A0A5A7SIB0_CUCMM|nr:Gag-pro-like protein [Cucumis melo var. makuwa]